MQSNRRSRLVINAIAVCAVFLGLYAIIAAKGTYDRTFEILMIQVGYNIIMVASLNIVTGYLGELALGHAGFMSVGAYASAIFTTTLFANQGWAFLPSLVAGGLAAALIAFLIGIPAFRLRGDYLAIITLGFGEIIRVLMNTVFEPWTGGGKSMYGIPLYTNFVNVFWIVAVTITLLFMLVRSRQGRAIIAIKENEVAAQSSGVPVFRYKMLAFVISAFFAGVAGGLYAHSVSVLNPAKFDFNKSIDYLVMVVFGGMGSLTGSIVAATGLTLVQYFMSALVEYRQLAYALLLIIMMIFKPAGLLGDWEFSLSQTLFYLRDKLFSEKEPVSAFAHVKNPAAPEAPDYSAAKDAPVLETKSLGIRFGGLHAAEMVSLTLSEGEIVGLIGPNGAGKTTIFNLLTGIYTPTEGTVLLLGKPIVGKKPHEITKLGVARTFQNIRLFKTMTVLDNIKVAFQSRMHYTILDSMVRSPRFMREEAGIDLKARELLRVFGMERLKDTKASGLPYGQQRKLEICRALASGPKVLLLDEPAAGMNPSETRELMDTISLIREKFHVAILLIEHDMKLVMGICQRIYVLNYGQVIAQGTPEAISHNPEVVAAYLGGHGAEDTTGKGAPARC